MTGIDNELPKGFNFFAGLCIVLGAIGLLFNSAFLILSIAPGTLPPKIQAVAPAYWLSAFHLAQDLGNVFGGIKVKKHMNWARLLIVICNSVGLIEMIYNTISSVSSGELQITPITISFFLIPVFIDSSIIYYFSRQTVRDFVNTSAA